MKHNDTNHHASENIDYWLLKHVTQNELPGTLITVPPPKMDLPEGTPPPPIDLPTVIVTGVHGKIELPKGIAPGDLLLFAMSSDAAIRYSFVHVVQPEDYGKTIDIHVTGVSFAGTAGRKVAFAYNVARGENIVMMSDSVNRDVRG